MGVNEELERLRNYVLLDANCPCCRENWKCLPDCTFEEDCPDEADRMKAARYALTGRAEDAKK